MKSICMRLWHIFEQELRLVYMLLADSQEKVHEEQKVDPTSVSPWCSSSIHQPNLHGTQS